MNSKKVLNIKNFRIKKNVISFNNTLLQISNISHVSIEPLSKYKFSIWPFIIGVIGLLMIKGGYSEISQMMGKIIILLVITYVIIVVLFNPNNGERYLHLYLNSGKVYTFYCTDFDFLEIVMKEIEYCINNHSVQNVRIDFDKCKVYNSPITIGNRNEVK